jgi:hypothetical protein
MYGLLVFFSGRPGQVLVTDAQEMPTDNPLLTSAFAGVVDSPHITIIVLMRVNHFVYTMYNIYTIYTHSLTDSLLLTETADWLSLGSACAFIL